MKTMEERAATSATPATEPTSSSRARPLSSGWKRLAVGVLVLAIGVALPIAAFVTRRTAPPIQPASGGDVLLGTALADSLGSRPITSLPVTGCNYFIRLKTGTGYCLDSVVANDHDAKMLMIQIDGREPTDIDERIFNLQEQMEALPPDESYDAQRAAFAQQIENLREQAGS
jgi:hypothetical protein